MVRVKSRELHREGEPVGTRETTPVFVCTTPGLWERVLGVKDHWIYLFQTLFELNVSGEGTGDLKGVE